jgi:hypothetical protein
MNSEAEPAFNKLCFLPGVKQKYVETNTNINLVASERNEQLYIHSLIHSKFCQQQINYKGIFIYIFVIKSYWVQEKLLWRNYNSCPLQDCDTQAEPTKLPNRMVWDVSFPWNVLVFIEIVWFHINKFSLEYRLSHHCNGLSLTCGCGYWDLWYADEAAGSGHKRIHCAQQGDASLLSGKHVHTLHTTNRRFSTLRETSSALSVCDATHILFPLSTP